MHWDRLASENQSVLWKILFNDISLIKLTELCLILIETWSD